MNMYIGVWGRETERDFKCDCYMCINTSDYKKIIMWETWLIMEPLFFFFGLLQRCLLLTKREHAISGLQPHNPLLQAETGHKGSFPFSSCGREGHRLNAASVRRCHAVPYLTSICLFQLVRDRGECRCRLEHLADVSGRRKKYFQRDLEYNVQREQRRGHKGREPNGYWQSSLSKFSASHSLEINLMFSHTSIHRFHI